MTRLDDLRNERAWRRDRVIALGRERNELPRWRWWRRGVLADAIELLAFDIWILDAQIEVAEIAAEAIESLPMD